MTADGSPPANVETFFTTLFSRDPSGRSWLSALLAATPRGQESLGTLVESPGFLEIPLAVPGVSGRLACLEYAVPPPRDLLTWLVDHPERLTWPEEVDGSPQAVKLRRALLQDDPPGSQAKAADRAKELAATESPRAHAWWRFEGMTRLDCVLLTDRLAVTVVGDRIRSAPAQAGWYPARSDLVRHLEAARGLSTERRWATLLISGQLLPEASEESLSLSLEAAAPHLDAVARHELRDAYLGNVTWEAARRAVGL